MTKITMDKVRVGDNFYFIDHKLLEVQKVEKQGDGKIKFLLSNGLVINLKSDLVWTVVSKEEIASEGYDRFLCERQPSSILPTSSRVEILESVFEKYQHLNGPLSDPEFQTQEGRILNDL
jgi:hypothetical protein